MEGQVKGAPVRVAKRPFEGTHGGNDLDVKRRLVKHDHVYSKHWQVKTTFKYWSEKKEII